MLLQNGHIVWTRLPPSGYDCLGTPWLRYQRRRICCAVLRPLGVPESNDCLLSGKEYWKTLFPCLWVSPKWLSSKTCINWGLR